MQAGSQQSRRDHIAHCRMHGILGSGVRSPMPRVDKLERRSQADRRADCCVRREARFGSVFDRADERDRQSRSLREVSQRPAAIETCVPDPHAGVSCKLEGDALRVRS
jgi:hypothetical protein